MGKFIYIIYSILYTYRYTYILYIYTPYIICIYYTHMQKGVYIHILRNN